MSADSSQNNNAQEPQRSETRVDAPHQAAHAMRSSLPQNLPENVESMAESEGAASKTDKIVEEVASSLSGVISGQAEDLAVRLQDQFLELEQRTEELISQETEVEARLSDARHWIDEQQASLDLREQEVTEREEVTPESLSTESSEAELHLQAELSYLQEVVAEKTELLFKADTTVASQAEDLSKLSSQLQMYVNEVVEKAKSEQEEFLAQEEKLKITEALFGGAEEKIMEAQLELSQTQALFVAANSRCENLEESYQTLAEKIAQITEERDQLFVELTHRSHAAEEDAAALLKINQTHSSEMALLKSKQVVQQSKLDEREAELTIEADRLEQQRALVLRMQNEAEENRMFDNEASDETLAVQACEFEALQEKFEVQQAELADTQTELANTAEQLERATAQLQEYVDGVILEQNQSASQEALTLAGQELELETLRNTVSNQVRELTLTSTKLSEARSLLQEYLEKETAVGPQQGASSQKQQSEFVELLAEHQAQAEEFQQVKHELNLKTEELSGSELHLKRREELLTFRQQEIETQLMRFKRLGMSEQRMAEALEEANQFRARAHYLDEAESLLAQEKTELADERRIFESEQRKFSQETSLRKRELNAIESRNEQECTQRQSKVGEREADLVRRQNAMEHLQNELRTGQREILEMRLATEETWSQLSGAMAPASLARSISQVRSRLADHYRLTLREINDRRDLLNNLRSEVSEQHATIEHQRGELESWSERREEDIQQQAARLIAREQELDRQQQYFEQAESRWTVERKEYKEDIQKLLQALRTVEIDSEKPKLRLAS